MAAKPTKPKGKHGGARPNSGRPKTKIVETRLSKMLVEEFEKLGDDLMPAVRELIRGVQVLHYDKKGEGIVYRQPPNAQMIQYVIDRLLGKVPTRTELTGGKDADGNDRPIPLRILDS